MSYDDQCAVTCTHNDKVVDAEVGNFKSKEFVEVYIATNKIHMRWNGKIYVGGMAGMEFTTPGPREFKVKNGRGRYES